MLRKGISFSRNIHNWYLRKIIGTEDISPLFASIFFFFFLSFKLKDDIMDPAVECYYIQSLTFKEGRDQCLAADGLAQ